MSLVVRGIIRSRITRSHNSSLSSQIGLKYIPKRNAKNVLDLQKRQLASEAQNLTSSFEKNPLENDVALYHEISNQTLHEILAKCETLEDLDIPGFDAEEHDGVFELKLGSKGTYVINKQSPNRQIWLSSPISGPKRYNWDANTKQWRNTRDGHLLYEIVSKEISQLLGIDFSLP